MNFLPIRWSTLPRSRPSHSNLQNPHSRVRIPSSPLEQGLGQANPVVACEVRGSDTGASRVLERGSPRCAFLTPWLRVEPRVGRNDVFVSGPPAPSDVFGFADSRYVLPRGEVGVTMSGVYSSQDTTQARVPGPIISPDP